MACNVERQRKTRECVGPCIKLSKPNTKDEIIALQFGITCVHGLYS